MSTRITVRVFACPSCSHMFNWIEDRNPFHCPECGEAMTVTNVGRDGISMVEPIGETRYTAVQTYASVVAPPVRSLGK